MKKNIVITIGRQFGSGGRSVARILAEHYGIPVYDKKLIELAAEQSGLGEQFFAEADEHVSHSFLHFLFGGRGATSHHAQSPLSNDALFKVQSDVIRDIASRESCIILGRCADYILRDQPGLISLFITADDADRQQRYAQHDGTTPEAARPILEKSDRKRSSYYGYYAQRTWGAADNYDLCLNTSRLGIEGTAQLVIDYIDRRLAKDGQE